MKLFYKGGKTADKTISCIDDLISEAEHRLGYFLFKTE